MIDNGKVILVSHPSLEDVDAIVSFQLAMAMESEGLKLDRRTLEKGVAAVMEDRTKGRYFVAKCGNELVGSLMVTPEWSDWNNCEHWWIQSVYVKPEYRRQGVFTALCREVDAQAQSEGVKYVRLYADRNNLAARSCYQSLGFDEGHYLMMEKGL